MTATLELDGVTKRFGRGHLEVDALTEVTMSVNPGELVAVMGPSGSGKTQLLVRMSCSRREIRHRCQRRRAADPCRHLRKQLLVLGCGDGLSLFNSELALLFLLPRLGLFGGCPRAWAAAVSTKEVSQVMVPPNLFPAMRAWSLRPEQ